ncbi:hypothetical protein ACOMHN_060125 [Nucella lapillus]
MLLEHGKLHQLRKNAKACSKLAQNTEQGLAEDGRKQQVPHSAESSELAADLKLTAHSTQTEHPDPTPHRHGETQSHTSDPQPVPADDSTEMSQGDREASSRSAENCTEVFTEDREASSYSGKVCGEPSSEERGEGSYGREESSMAVSPQTASQKTSGRSSTRTFSANLDAALNTLKSDLMAMREQDLQLLKQLIHINDNIRRLKRARWLQRGGRTASCELLGARSTAPHLPSGGYGPGVAGKEGGGGGCMLQRQKSEPGLLLGVPCYRKASTSSSFETIEDGDEEADSLYGSFSDLPSDSSPTPSPFSPCKPPTPTTRSPSAYTYLAFSKEELWRGECSYGEILKRNIRLWKWSVAHERESGMAGGHFCLL